MIITVTMNPAIDQTAETDWLTPGGIHRLKNIVRDAGGKGINVAKTIAGLGGRVIATGFLGGMAGQEMEHLLERLPIQTDFVLINGNTRTNLKIISPAFGTTEFNEPGPAVSSEALKTLQLKLVNYAAEYTRTKKPGDPAIIFVFSGRLPHKTDPIVYWDLITAVKAAGASVFLDADGPALRIALTARPNLIKPNLNELIQYFNLTAQPSLSECVELCRHFIDGGVDLTVLSLGHRGALFVSLTETLYAPGLSVPVLSTVGAGDSMVGALCYAFEHGAALREAAALAVAVSAGAVTTQGTRPPEQTVVDSLLPQVTFQSLP